MKNIWISGSINSGKSTVAKILSKRLKMAMIELDSFSDFVSEFMDFEQYVQLNYELIPEIVEMYNSKKIGVVVVYPIGETTFSLIEDKNRQPRNICFRSFSRDRLTKQR